MANHIKKLMHHSSEKILASSTVIFCVISVTIIIFANYFIKIKGEQIVNSGLAQASSDLLVVRRQFDEMLNRVALLEANALLAENSYSNHLPDFEARLEGLRQEIAIAGQGFGQVTFSDQSGIIRWSTHSLPPNPVDVSDRDYFQNLSTKNIDRFVGEANFGKLTNKLTMPFAFKLRDINGHFIGIITIRMSEDITRNLLAGLSNHRYSMVSIARNDGQLIGRSTNSPNTYAIRANGPLPKLVSNTVIDGSFTGLTVSPIDGISRFLATSYNSEWRLILAVGNETQPEMAMLQFVKRRIAIIAALMILGSLAIIVCIARLVYRQRKMQLELVSAQDVARREAVLRQVAENATDMIAMMDAEFRYIYVNEAWRRHLGLDPQKSIGKRMGHSHDPKPHAEECRNTLAREGGSVRFLVDVPHVNGTKRWLDVELVAVDIRVDDYVSPCRYFSISRDVTERILAEQSLMASQQRLEKIMRLGPGFFFEAWIGTNGDVRISLPVDVQGRFLGYSVADATRNGVLWDQTAPQDVEHRREARRRCIATGWASVEFSVTAADGSVHRMLNQMGLSVNDHTGATIIAFMTDITSEYETRMRLRHSEQLATLGLASANIAHEMNQPLASMTLAVENAVNAIENGHATPERIIAKLTTIGAQAQRLSQMVNRVRKFSRDEQGSTSVFSLSQAIEEAVALAEARIRSASVNMRVELPVDLPDLHADCLLLEQVLLNLILNACDAYNSAGSTSDLHDRPLTISAAIVAQNLIIRIADRAGGIAPHILPNLFKPFATSKPAGQGTGLGLSICAENARLLGGQITAHNQSGGAMFEIELPFAAFTAPEPARPHHDQTAEKV